MIDVQYTDELRDDLVKSMIWMDERKLGLCAQLEEEFHASVAVVRGRPYSFAPDHTSYRPCKLRRFNAVLYFKRDGTLLVNAEVIVVMGLFVGGRDESRLRDCQ